MYGPISFMIKVCGDSGYGNNVKFKKQTMKNHIYVTCNL